MNKMIPELYKIVGRQEETHDVFTLDLSPEGNKMMAFKPGQFNMLYLFGVGEVPISISGDPGGSKNLIHTIRRVGTVTNQMNRLTIGDSVGIRGPFGSHWPIEKAVGKDILFVTGGLGLAPLRPAFYHVLQHRENYESVTLLYGARTPEDILYLEELKHWRSQLDLEVEVTVDNGEQGWNGHVGVVTKLIPSRLINPGNTTAFICGPEIMMKFTILALQSAGVNQTDIYLSMERNMKCALGFCGHCQFGPHFICKDGPVFTYKQIESIFEKAEI